MKKIFFALIILVPVLLLTGCPKPPLQEIADAKAALESARIAGAQTYAPKEYSSAKGYVQKAQDDSDNRQYNDAKVEAITGKQLADAAKALALARQAKGGGENGGGTFTGSASLAGMGITEGSITGTGSLGEGVIIKQLKRIQFAFDDYSLSNNAQAILIESATWLNGHPAVKIQIEGHCDERGSAEYNLALGEKRAEAARNYLRQLGVGADRMSVISYGKERPLNPAHNEKAWAENRRDEFVVVSR